MGAALRIHLPGHPIDLLINGGVEELGVDKKIFMESFQVRQRIEPSASPLVEETVDRSSKLDEIDFQRIELKFRWPLRIPSSMETAVTRINYNLRDYALFYVHFVWIVLAITLIPKRKISFICLTMTTYVASAYLLLLRSFPESYWLHVVIDKRVVLILITMVAMIEVIATESGLHLMFTLVGATPVVLAHAVLWVNEQRRIKGDQLIQEAVADAEAGEDP